MTTYTRAAPVVGDQLAAEIRAATGLAVEVSVRLPDQVVVLPDVPDVDLVGALVAAHTPEESAVSAARRVVVQVVSGAVGVAWPDLTAAQRQALIVALLFKAGALDRQARVRQLSDWL